MNAPSLNNREFAFTKDDFKTVAGLILKLTGIVLSDNKFDMAYGRIVRRLRDLKMQSARQYLQLLSSPQGEDELMNLINAMTTNLTSFFREKHHFDLLLDHLQNRWVPEFRSGTRNRLRIWSAGCSSGEEAYCLAATLVGEIGTTSTHDALILASDIDTGMLDKGKSGTYKLDALQKSNFPSRFYTASGSMGQMRQELGKRIRFRQLNLHSRWPFSGKFDVIFCRNVLIYFDAPTRAALVERFVQNINPGGLLCLGHSESKAADGLDVKPLGKAAFQIPEIAGNKR